MTTYIGQALSLKASAVGSVDHYERNERARDIGPEDLNSGPEDLRLTGLTRGVELPPHVHLGGAIAAPRTSGIQGKSVAKKHTH